MKNYSSYAVQSGVNWNKIGIMLILFLVAFFIFSNPAFASSDFGDAANAIKAPTCEAFRVGRIVLITAAVLALIIGLAPMLWGEIKAKWIISSLVVCAVLGSIPAVVQAFGMGTQGCSG